MYEIQKLPNGLRVITEHLPYVRSVSIGIWLGTGSMHEKPSENGLSHFLEHMLFKGTDKRTARSVAEEMDRVGAQINAFTSKECTCYYAKAVDEHLATAFDVLSDLVLNASLPEDELNKERGVILEEIAMQEDSPEDLVHDLLSEAVFRGHPLALPILGTTEKIENYSRADLKKYKDTHYRPNNCVLSVAGNFDKAELWKLIESTLGGWKAEGEDVVVDKPEGFQANLIAKTKDIEQVHICLGFPGVALGSDDSYAISIFNNIYGGGMSSRLFQRIREELGMAYSVYTYPSMMPGIGMMTVYAGTSQQHVEQVLSQLRGETARLIADGVSADEFQMAKEQLKGGFILGLESSSARMSNIGRSLLLLDHVRTETEVLDAIAKVTPEQMMRVAGECVLAPHSATIVGRAAERVPAEWLMS
ncbi:MAG: insulinase family protein [Oscillospiraceae bacterium]|nr:insulinase family protein [Oscillospiraceae bacterium]